MQKYDYKLLLLQTSFSSCAINHLCINVPQSLAGHYSENVTAISDTLSKYLRFKVLQRFFDELSISLYCNVQLRACFIGKEDKELETAIPYS